jgi:pseudouridine synthase
LSKESSDGLIHHLNFSERVYPIGRLDKYSEGLLLLTNDGDFAFQLGHPRFGHEKVYHVTLNAPLTEPERKALSTGIVLDDGEETRPCVIEHLHDATYRWVLVEGKNRQIRRMAAVVDLTVKKLVRISFGGLPLGDLRPGAWRALTETEKACLLDAEMRALVQNATALAPAAKALPIIKPKPPVIRPHSPSAVRPRAVINPRSV